MSRAFARHLKPIQLLFDLMKGVVADFVVVSHRKNGFACGTERSTLCFGMCGVCGITCFNPRWFERQICGHLLADKLRGG